MRNISSSPPRIVLAGSVGSSRRTLQGLLRHSLPVVAVLGLSASKAMSVSGYARMDEIAASANVPYFDFVKINAPDVVNLVRKCEPDLLFVVGLSQIVCKELLEIPKLGCIGFHPTFLPEGRGRAPVAWLVYEGKPGAATFFLMEESADSGPIFIQEPFSVSKDDYASDVIERLENAIDCALDRWLPKLYRGEWKPMAQDQKLATYYGKRGPEDGHIDWNNSASQIYALVRAASRPHPGAYTYYGGHKLIIWRAELATNVPHKGVAGRIVFEDSQRGWLVQTGDGLLWMTNIEWADLKADMEPPRLRIGMRLGYIVEDEIYLMRQRISLLEEQIEKQNDKDGSVK